MRYRLMASYLGASYQAAVGPSDRDVTLFAAPPPPEEHGFSPAPSGIWRRQVRLNDIDALWESRPIGSYRAEPCLVLDDQGDRLHIVYLGMDERRAGQLGYWQVDRGVFEVVVPRQEVADLAEERHEFPIALLLAALPRGGAPGPQQQPPTGAQLPPPAGAQQPLTGARQLPAAAPQAAVGPPAGLLQAGGAPHAAVAPQAGGPQAGGPPQLPGAQQLPVRPQLPGPPQPPHPPPPAAAAAWHGSPAADGNGTWYYQDGGTAQNGTQPHGSGAAAGATWLPAGYGDGPQDGYRQLAPGTPQAPSNGIAGAAAQYSPPAPQQPVQAFLPAQQPQPAQPQAPQPQPVQPQAAQPPQLTQQPHSALLPQSAQLAQPMPLASPVQPSQPLQTAPQVPQPAPHVQAAPRVQPGAAALAPPVSAMAPAPTAPAQAASAQTVPAASTLADTAPTGPLIPLPSMPPPSQASQPSQQAQAAPAPSPATQPSALSKLTGAVRGRRAARKPRLAMSAVFADLVDMAAISRSAYAVDEEVTGAMCLFKADGGYEVFSCAEDARHEVRFFEDEEAAYFYLFGVLAAEALRNGRLTPRRA